MTLRHILSKNLLYNLKQFTSYIFVNSFVVSVLFMYGSLLFNDRLKEGIAVGLANQLTSYAAYATIIFSIIFITYTGIYFVKSRGKEFGVYLTLGMTTKDLILITVFENLVVMAISSFIGIITGVLFSKLFYLILAKILKLSSDIFFISSKTFLLSIGIFIIIFSFNIIFTSIFIKTLSIVDITKSSTKKGISKSRPIVGIISLVLFIISMIGFYVGSTIDSEALSTLLNVNFINSLMEYKDILEPIVMVTTLVSLYFVIAFFIDGIRWVISYFPKVYNKYILTLSNLKHRFFSYKVSLYIVTLLVALSIYFIGFGLSTYIFIGQSVDKYIPYDFMIESTENINVINEKDIRDIVKSSGSSIKYINSLEFLVSENYQEGNGQIKYLPKNSMIVSESNYNKYMGTDIDVELDELLQVYNEEDLVNKENTSNSVITIERWREGQSRANSVREKSVTIDKFTNSLSQGEYLQFDKNKIKVIYEPFINSYGNFEFKGVVANVIDDDRYNKIVNGETRNVFLFNVEENNRDAVNENLLNELRIRNNDKNLWKNEQVDFETRDDAETLRPIYKSERHEGAFQISGLVFFTVMFLGILFLVASIVVLYYKIVTDIEDEREQVRIFRKIGLTSMECKKYLKRHLAILFFVPLVVGGILGMYFVYISFVFTSLVSYMKICILIMYLLFLGLSVVFYISLSSKFISEIEI